MISHTQTHQNKCLSHTRTVLFSLKFYFCNIVGVGGKNFRMLFNNTFAQRAMAFMVAKLIAYLLGFSEFWILVTTQQTRGNLVG